MGRLTGRAGVAPSSATVRGASATAETPGKTLKKSDFELWKQKQVKASVVSGGSTLRRLS
jgi:hypothetical protein